MIRAARAWIALWDRREPPHALAAVRIALAVVLLYDYLVAWHLGLVESLWSVPPDGFALLRDTWSARWFGTGPESATLLWAAGVIALVAVATGTLTRLACALTVLISAQLAMRAPDADRGIDALIRIVFVILALSRSHAVWSVDAWIARRWLRRPPPAEVPAWPRYLLFAQLIWVYFSGGHNKTGLEWGPLGGFSALANALSDPHFARFDPGWIEPIYPLTRVATAATMLFELGAPAMILLTYYAATADRPGRLRGWCNRWHLRWLWIATGLMFHVGIAITMKLGIFPAAMIALYPVLLIRRDVAAMRQRLERGAR